MATGRIVFENISELLAAARGAPGKRTFYLIAGHSDRWVRVWMEKTQMQTLGESIEQILTAQSSPGQSEDALLSTGDPPGQPAAEFQAGRLGLGHDPDRDMIVLLAQAPEEEPVVQFWATKEQMRALSKRITEVVAAGRPVCALCGGPIDPHGHMCVKANGHHRIPA
jgi:uncharacterized repeat protein (TIGR03847 family)